MVDRSIYNHCMKPYIQGTGKTPEERRLDFCIGAKICSGKTSDKDQARQICLTEPPREKKPRGSRAKVDPHELASCIIAKADGELTVDSLSTIIAGCVGVKLKKQTKREKIEAGMTPEQLEALEAIATLAAEMGTG